jgi:hypothetical protein
LLFTVFGVGVGFFLILNPAQAINIQQRFYAKINWRIEPISMQKEIRNTKIMGWFLIIIIIVTLILYTKIIF